MGVMRTGLSTLRFPGSTRQAIRFDLLGVPDWTREHSLVSRKQPSDSYPFQRRRLAVLGAYLPVSLLGSGENGKA